MPAASAASGARRRRRPRPASARPGPGAGRRPRSGRWPGGHPRARRRAPVAPRRSGPGGHRASAARVISWRPRSEPPRLRLDQVRGALHVPRGERVPDRLRRLAVCLPPGAGAAVQLGHVVGMLVEQAGPEQVGEQVVVAVPAPPVVERDEEQVGALERLEHRRPARAAGDRVAQRAGEPVEDGGPEEEVPDGVGLALEDLVGEVVDDVAVVARERRDERGDILASPHRDRGELESRDPALRPRLERVHVGARERESHPVVEVRGRLVGREPEVGGADLDELAPGTHAGERQRRVGAGEDRPGGPGAAGGRAGRRDPRRSRGASMTWRSSSTITRSPATVCQVVERARRSRGRPGPGRPPGGRGAASPTPGSDPGDGGDDVGPERGGLVVGRLERDPRRGPLAPWAAIHWATSVVLPKPGWRGDQRQLGRGAAPQAVEQACPVDGAGARERRVQLGPEELGHDARMMRHPPADPGRRVSPAGDGADRVPSSGRSAAGPRASRRAGLVPAPSRVAQPVAQAPVDDDVAEPREARRRARGATGARSARPPRWPPGRAAGGAR